MSERRPSAYSATTIETESERAPPKGSSSALSLLLVIAWCAEEPQRVGEVAFLTDRKRTYSLGRGPGDAEGASSSSSQRLKFFRQRPGTLVEGAPLGCRGLSRQQLEFTFAPAAADKDGPLRVQKVGKCPLAINGERVDESAIVELAVGDVLTLRRELILLVTERPAMIPAARQFAVSNDHGFGEADAVGIIGESPGTWRLRETIAFAAKADAHVLILGESGTGKELAARALHKLSKRATKAFVSRNAATLPAGLIDAELFGNARNYPNAGMPERAGLVGEANGGSLFLDEIGELPSELQAHLLRVLDTEGEYQRLGESQTRRSDLRLVAATNRDASALKHDFVARLTARVDLPSLTTRREDIPLLARHLLLRAARKNPELVARFVAQTAEGYEYGQFDPQLIEHMLRRPYALNIRELDALLWRAFADSETDVITLPFDLRPQERLSRPEPSRPEPTSAQQSPLQPQPQPQPTRPDPTLDEIKAALASNANNVRAASKALGLSSRYALYRWMKRYGIEADDD